MGRVRKGRKSSNLFFFFRNPRKPSHVEFCSEPFLDTATFDNHRAQHAQNLLYICPFLTANNSKDFKKRKRSEGCDSLLPVGNLCFSVFFAKIIDLQLSSKEKLRFAKFQTSLDAVDFSAFKTARHISSTHGKSQGKSVQFRHSFICWPVLPELIGSRFSHAKDLRYFSLLQKARWILAKVFTPTFNELKWMDRVVG